MSIESYDPLDPQVVTKKANAFAEKMAFPLESERSFIDANRDLLHDFADIRIKHLVHGATPTMMYEKRSSIIGDPESFLNEVKEKLDLIENGSLRREISDFLDLGI